MSDIEVVESNPDSLFDSSAIFALQKWVYTPPEKKLKNKSVMLEFKLDASSSSSEFKGVEKISVEPS